MCDGVYGQRQAVQEYVAPVDEGAVRPLLVEGGSAHAGVMQHRGFARCSAQCSAICRALWSNNSAGRLGGGLVRAGAEEEDLRRTTSGSTAHKY